MGETYKNETYVGDFASFPKGVGFIGWTGIATDQGDAVYTNVDGDAWILSSSSPMRLTSSRSSTALDSGQTFANASASNYTFTVVANTILQPLTFQQESTGAITLAAGAGVTFIGATLATSAQGMLITLLPTTTPNLYIVKVSA